MTDPKTEWRDAEGRFTRRDNGRGGLEFNGDLTGAITITDEDAGFLLRYLPEALGIDTSRYDAVIRGLCSVRAALLDAADFKPDRKVEALEAAIDLLEATERIATGPSQVEVELRSLSEKVLELGSALEPRGADQEATEAGVAGNASAFAPLFALLREMISQVTAGPIVRREQREAFGYALQACERFFGCPELAAVNHRPFANRLEELRRAGVDH